MDRPEARLVGVELYFDDLPRAKAFYADVLGLALADEAPDHHAKFQAGETFFCVLRSGGRSRTHQPTRR